VEGLGVTFTGKASQQRAEIIDLIIKALRAQIFINNEALARLTKYVKEGYVF
jgi:hypothetical protein